MDFILWLVAIFALIYGVLLLALPGKKLTPIIIKQLNNKGNSDPTSEDVDKKLKLFRIMGFVCIVAGAALSYINLTGGIFAF